MVGGPARVTRQPTVAVGEFPISIEGAVVVGMAPMDTEIRLGMVGAGGHASKAIYPNFYKLQGGRVVANADLDVNKARAVGEQHGIRAHYADWKKMAEAEKLHGIYVCISDVLHARIAKEAMAMGLHVYVEKPHAPDLEAARTMIVASKEHGRICMVAYKKRYTPAYNKAKEITCEADFGSIARVSIARSMGGNDQRSPDYLWQWGCHAIDLVEYFGGEPEEVMAYRTTTSTDDWRTVSAILRFPAGHVGELTLSSPGGNWEEVVVQGSKMQAVRVWDGLYTARHYGNEIVGGAIPSFASQADGDRLQGFVVELQGFIDAIRTGRQPASNAVTAARARALYEAMMESVSTGQPTKVPQVEDVL